jgi:hypothetical protein
VNLSRSFPTTVDPAEKNLDFCQKNAKIATFHRVGEHLLVWRLIQEVVTCPGCVKFVEKNRWSAATSAMPIMSPNDDLTPIFKASARWPTDARKK